MTEMAQRKSGGRAFHSIVEPHFNFIHQLRQRRKTWQEIAELLFTEKGVRVTLYAPYRFYRRKLKRAAKPDWEAEANLSQSEPTQPKATVIRPQSRPAPLPPKITYKQPNISPTDIEPFT